MEINSKIIRSLLLIVAIPLALVIFGLVMYFFYPRSALDFLRRLNPAPSDQISPFGQNLITGTPPPLQPGSVVSPAPLTNKYPGSYQTITNKDGSMDVFYAGRIQSVSQTASEMLAVNLLVLKGGDDGQVVSILLPTSPPAQNSQLLGNNFQQMFTKGFNSVVFRIRYDKNGKFLEWMLV